MRKRFLLALLVMLLPTLAWAQTATVTGHMVLPSGSAPTNSKVCATLLNYKPNSPHVVGTGTIVTPSVCVTPAADGSFSTSLIENANISPVGTYWRFDFYANGVQQSSSTFLVNHSPFNIDTEIPLSAIPGAGPNQLIVQVYPCVVPVASLTWTCAHNFNDPTVFVETFDGNSKQVYPDSIDTSNINTTTIHWVTPQAGKALIMHAGNIALTTTQPNAVLQNPLAGQTIQGPSLGVNTPATFSGPTTFSGTTSIGALNTTGPVVNTGSITSAKDNGVVWVDGVTYTTIAAAYAALPSTGGCVHVPPNYAETLSANLVLNKSFSCLYFEGPATITQGTFFVSIPSPTTNVAIRGAIPFGSNTAGGPGVVFVYTGTGAAIRVGDSSATTTSIHLGDIAVKISTADVAAEGILATRTQSLELTRPRVFGLLTANSQNLIHLDGTSSAPGSANTHIEEPYLSNGHKAIVVTGDIVLNNHNQLVGGLITGIADSGSIGIDVQTGAGFTCLGTDVENYETGYSVSSTSNRAFNGLDCHTGEGTTTSFKFGASSLQNFVITDSQVAINDLGTGNTVWATGTGLNAQVNVPGTLAVAGVTNATGDQLFNTSTTCTTAASAGAVCTTAAITLPVAYADTNYRVSCTGLAPTNVPVVESVAKSNSTFTIKIAALTAAAATYASYDCRVGHN